MRAIQILLLAALVASCAPGDRSSQTLITNATVIDGTGAPSYIASLRIVDGAISALGDLSSGSDDVVVDGYRMVLAPGFIDVHSHHDRDTDDPTRLAAISQGITTIVVGQDGFSEYPLSDFLDSLTTHPWSVNVASYSGHNTLRSRVLGDSSRPATPGELHEMARLLGSDMEAGALGLSTGLEYEPGRYSTTEEIVELASVAAEYGGRYASHMRSEDVRLEGALDELLQVGVQAHIPVHISHFKLARLGVWGQAEAFLSRLDEARARGVDVTADVYPYEHWMSTMTVVLSRDDFGNRTAYEYVLAEIIDPSEFYIARYDADTSLVGLKLEDVAEREGTDLVSAYMNLVAQSQAQNARESIIAKSMTESDVATIMGWPHSSISSDGSGSSNHPRGHGTFPRVIHRFVNALEIMTLEEAVRKMTSASAANAGIHDRGVIEVGASADLVLFDPGGIRDRASFDEPHLASEGIHSVWVNGALVYREGSATGVLPGQVIRR